MEITYIGHSCFKIKGKETTLVIDPFSDGIGYKVSNQKADILLLTHHHSDHNNIDSVSGYDMLIDNPGEYEHSGVIIYGLPTYHDDKKGEERGKNTIYTIDIEGFRLLHLGDLGHTLQKTTLEKLSDIDVLFVPVGGVFTIDAATAAQVVASLEPKLVVPMHYQTDKLDLGEKLDEVKKFLDELGIENPDTQDSLKLTSSANLPEETEVVVLKHTA